MYNRICAITWAAGNGSGGCNGGCSCGCGCGCWNGDGLPRNCAIRSWTINTKPSGFWRDWDWTSYIGGDANTEAYIRFGNSWGILLGGNFWGVWGI